MGRRLKIIGSALLFGAAGVYAANSNWPAPRPSQQNLALAHRGVHQTFSIEDVRADTCTASRITPPAHALIENTLPSIKAAFEAGAGVVEFDIHPTADGHFAVFHDWTLDRRTDGKGVTRQFTLAQLQRLDVGYGYTADGGSSFPLRGRGVGLMPSLDEVLAAFPGKRFLIHVKSRDPSEGRMLAARLSQLQPMERRLLTVYGADEPLDEIRSALPDLRIASRGRLKQCLIHYIAVGWSGHVPQACRGAAMFTPVNVAPWLWGWPNRLAARLAAADSILVVLGAYDGGEFTSGVDTPEAAASLPNGFGGWIWTNRIETIGPLLRR